MVRILVLTQVDQPPQDLLLRPFLHGLLQQREFLVRRSASVSRSETTPGPGRALDPALRVCIMVGKAAIRERNKVWALAR